MFELGAVIIALIAGILFGRRQKKEKANEIHHETRSKITEAEALAGGRDVSDARERLRARARGR